MSRTPTRAFEDAPAWLRSLWPAESAVGAAERLRSCAGALVGILLCGALSAVLLGPSAQAFWLIAPMGASAVLLFAVPASPLAQPWSIVGGNLCAGLIGVCCAKLIAVPVAAACVAIALAIAAMFALRCLHPPSGAVALTAVLGGPAVHAAGFGFVLVPVLLNSLLLLAVALVYNRALGRRYPHAQRLAPPPSHATADPAPTARLGFKPEDLLAVLKGHGQVLDISVDDLDTLFRRTEQQAFRRRFGETRCRDLMSRDVLTVDYATELADAWRLMHTHQVQALPVVDRARRVIGIVTRGDFLQHVDLGDYRSVGSRLGAFLRRTAHSHSSKHEAVGQIMHTPVVTVPQDTPIAELVPLMAGAGLHHLPVVDDARRLVGIVTQTDLVAALYETSLAALREPAAA